MQNQADWESASDGEIVRVGARQIFYCSWFLIDSSRALNSAMVKGLGRKYCMPASWASRLVSASLLALMPMITSFPAHGRESLFFPFDSMRCWAFSLARSRNVASIPSASTKYRTQNVSQQKKRRIRRFRRERIVGERWKRLVNVCALLWIAG